MRARCQQSTTCFYLILSLVTAAMMASLLKAFAQDAGMSAKAVRLNALSVAGPSWWRSRAASCLSADDRLDVQRTINPAPVATGRLPTFT